MKDEFKYEVHYFYDGTEDETKAELNKVATFGDEITEYTNKVIEGYKLGKAQGLDENGVEKDLPLVIKSDETKNKINVYYIKDEFKYEVHYFYDGIEDETKAKTGLKAVFGSEITTYDREDKVGYKFKEAKALNENGEEAGMPLVIKADESKNKINVYYEKDLVKYEIHYFYDGTENKHETVTNVAMVGSIVTEYTQKNIDGYKFKEAKALNENGEEADLPLTIKSDITKNIINVYYEKDEFKYEVHYFYEGIEDEAKADKENKALFGAEITEYTDKNIDGYKLEKAQALDTNSEETDLPLIIKSDESKNIINVYYIKADLGYEVHYFYDGVENKLKQENKNSTIGEIITDYKDKCIEGYKLQKAKALDENGEEVDLPLTIKSDTTKNIINVYYEKDEFKYEVHYFYDGVEDETKAEKDNKALYGSEITEYLDKSVTGFKFEKAQALDAEGIEDDLPLVIKADETKNIINVYYVKDMSSVIVKYTDNLTGKEIASSETITGQVGTNYAIQRKTFEGYRLDEDNLPTNESGTFTENGDTVTYKYIELRKYELEARYTAGEDEIDEAKIAVDFGDIHIEDYTTNGILKIGDIELTELGREIYTVYEVETPEYCKTIADKDNPEIVELEKQLNLEKSKYEFVPNYEKREGFNVIIDEENKKVIFDFTTVKNEKYDLAVKKFITNIDGTDITNREPKVIVSDEGKITYEGNNEIEKISNNQNVTYTIRMYNESDVRAKGKRVIEHIPDGLVFIPDNEVNKNFEWKMCKVDSNGRVSITENPEEADIVITDYLVGKTIGKFDIDTKTVNYLDVQAVFKVDESKIATEDRIIENRVQIMKNKNDDNTENNETTEKLYVKYFDLSVEKYIANVKVKTNDDERNIEVGYDKKDTLVKVDVKRSEQEQTKLIVTYGLLIKNVGEIPGYATEITDYIPEDFKLISTDIWMEEGNKATTKSLEDVLLNPGESTTVEVTFEWSLANGSIGSRINEAQITAYANEYDAKDITEDNKDNEEILVTVKTGSEVIKYIAMATLYVSIVALGVLVIKKKVVIRKK